MLERTEMKSMELTEKQKRQDDYLKNEIDASIAACLSYKRDKLIDAYNLRNGVRDAKDFDYLWAAYGIEFPAQIRHVPVLRAIFDSLVGQAISRPFNYQVGCVDSESVNYIFNEYRDAIYSDITQFYKNKIQAAAYVAKGGTDDSPRAQEYLQKLEKKFKGGNFKTDIEVLSSDLMEWAMQRFKLKGKALTFMEDLVTAGECSYQVKVIQKGQKPLIRILNPLNLFYTKSTDTKFIKHTDRVVYKERIPVTEAWTLYGHKMTKEKQTDFLDNWGKYIVGSDLHIIDYKFGTLESSARDMPTQRNIDIPMIDVHYVEWKSNNEVKLEEPEESQTDGDTENKTVNMVTRIKYQLDLYEGVRLGMDNYVNAGKSKHVIRDPDDLSNVNLTINGICYNDRNGEPYSLVLKTKAISDKIDVLHYHAENLLAISGTKAIMINYPDIPVWMGEDPQNRIMKWLGYVKQGISLVDYSQEGNGVGKFTNSGNVDLSMSNAILGIFQMLDSLEATAYKVTGVPRQAVGNITQNDGKGTTEIAIQGSQIVTQPLFTCFDEIVEEFLTDVVNACRVAYSDGLQGRIILGEEGQKIFSIMKDKLNLVNINVHINGDGTEQRDIDAIKLLAEKFIENEMIATDVAVDIVTMKSLTRIKNRIKDSISDQKQDKTESLNQQLEQFQAELDKANKLIEQLQNGDAQIKQQELAIREKEVAGSQDLKLKELDQKSAFDSGKLELDKRRVDLEALQLSYGGGGSKEIKNN